MFIYASKADKNREEKREKGERGLKKMLGIRRKGDKKEKGKSVKALSCLVVGTLLTSVVLVSLFASANCVSAKQITVDINGGADYTKIQDAINAASTGDTIVVKPGTYKEHLGVDKQVTLKGENYPIVDGEGTETVIWVIVDGVRIDGFKVIRCDPAQENTRWGIGVVANECVINNCIFSENNIGLNTGFNGNNVVSNCTFKDNRIGLVIDESEQNTVENNHFTGCGMILQDIKNSLISNNIIELSPNFGICVYAYSTESTDNAIVGNTIRSNSMGSFEIAGYESSTVYNNKIYHNNIIDNGCGYCGYQACDDGDNQWDNGAEGNYWSDYEGVDADGDGIGDTPYDKKSGAKDNYPLMEPWSSGVDFIPPTLTITSPAPGTTTDSPTITVTGTATDESGIASVTVNGVLASGAADWSTWSAEVTLAAEGENTITAVATDGAGLTTTKTVTVTYSNPVEKYAILVGIDDYPGEEKDLSASVASMNAIYDLLTIRYEFQEENVFRFTDSSAKEMPIFYALEDIVEEEQIDSNDIFVFYFSGHGGVNLSGNEYLYLNDSESDSRFYDCELDLVAKYLRKYYEPTVIMILDSCYSGGMAEETDIPPDRDGVDTEKALVLMGTSADKEVYEIKYFDVSLFTHFLYRAFTSSAKFADSDGNTKVSIEEAFNFARKEVKVISLTLQSPQIMDHYFTSADNSRQCYLGVTEPKLIAGALSCPAHLHIYDSEGRHTGLNDTGEGIEREIPGSYYSGPKFDPETIVVLGQSDNFRYKIEALSEGEFNFTLTQSTVTKTTTVTYLNVNITNTTVATVNVSQENPTYAMEIDNNGDGTPDCTKEPNSIEIVELLPDLTLSSTDISFSPASQPTEGDSVTITATVRNIGEAAASDFRVSFFDGDSLIGIDTISVTAGFTTTASTTWIAVAGDRTIKVVVDSGGAITESDETNNEASKTITVKEKAVPPTKRGGGGGGGGSRDTDGDGVSDVDEMLAGTDWRDPSDYPGKKAEEEAAVTTPTPSPSPTPTPTTTLLQPTTPTAVATPTTTPPPTEEPGEISGFEASLAVFGLLGVAYLLRRRREFF